MTDLHLIELNRCPILEQLLLEEALLRTDSRNFCIINRGAPPSIVLGCSNKPHELLDLDRVREAGIPMVQRFSGGGCVIIDQETLFCSFLFSKKDLPISPFPEPILRWAAEFYQTAWNFPEFELREQDYTLNDRKCGGNAQYIQKDRWLLHTSFLWNFTQSKMDLLRLPQKRPVYRRDRSHSDFLCSLNEYAPSQEFLTQGIKRQLDLSFRLHSFPEEDLPSIVERPHRISTKTLL